MDADYTRGLDADYAPWLDAPQGDPLAIQPIHIGPGRRFLVLSRRAAQTYVCQGRYAVISIYEPAEIEAPQLAESPLCHSVLRLQFHDVDPTWYENQAVHADIVLFTPAHAAKILAFMAGLPEDVQTIIVHCPAGVSRSPAVAAALEHQLGRDDSAYFRRFTPNRHVYQLLVAATGLPAPNRSGPTA